MSQPYTTFPIRFSADPDAMIAFWETLGLTREVHADDGGPAVFRGASGMVAVRGAGSAEADAEVGTTSLSFAVADVDTASAELSEAGLEPKIWDEPAGRQGSVRSPIGGSVGLSENLPRDVGGAYRVHEQTVAASLDITVVWYTTDFRRDAAFFAMLGFEPFDDLDNPWWCSLRAGRGQGVIGLHRAESDPVGAEALVEIGFETSEPLDALAGRLRAAGHDSATVFDDEVGTRVVVTDPDGRKLEIHPTS